MADVNLKIKSDTSDAERGLKKLDSAGDKLAGTFKAIGAAVAAGFAFSKITQGIGQVIDAASKQEDAVNSLNQAMRSAGDFSAGASEDLQRFASDLQAITTVGDEATIEMLALAKTFGVTNDQAKDLVKGAAELSAATGMSLDSAVRNLGKSLSGLAGELGESLPAMRSLTQEQLKAGAAIDLVNQRFAGSAAAKLNTYSGSVASLSNAWGDLQEEIGFYITKNPAVIRAIGALSRGIQQLSKFLGSERGGAIDFFLEALASIADAVPYAVRALDVLLRPFTATAVFILKAAEAALYFGESVLSIDAVANALDGISIRIIGEFQTIIDVILKAINTIESIPGATTVLPAGVRLGLEGTKKAFEGLKLGADRAAESVGPGLAEAVKSNMTNIRDGIRSATDVMTTGMERFADSVDGAGDSIRELKNGLPQPGEFDFVGPVKPDGSAGTPGGSTGAGTAGFGGTDFLKPFTAAGAVLAQSFLGNVTKGTAGGKAFAGAAVAQGVDLGVQALGGPPGVGAAIQPILTDLANASKEQARVMAQEFADGLGDGVVALVENLPIFIEALAEKSGEIAAAFITALVQGSPELIIALTKAMPLVAWSLTMELVDGIKYYLDQLGPTFNYWDEKIKGAGNYFEEKINAIFGADGEVMKIGNAFTEFGNTLATQIKTAVGDEFLEAGNELYDTMIKGAGDFVTAIIEKAGEVASSLDPTRRGGGTGGVVGTILGNGGDSLGGQIDTAIRDPGEQVENLFSLTGGSSQQVIRLQIDSRVLGEVILDLSSAGARLKR